MVGPASAGGCLMAWESAVPGAIDALYELVKGAVEAEGVTAKYGNTLDSSSTKEAVLIAYGSEDSTVPAVESEDSAEGYGVGQNRELFSINNVIRVRRGNGEIAVAIKRAYQVLGFVGQALAGNSDLSGTVMKARIGSANLQNILGPNGPQANLHFGVDCDAFSKL